MRNRKKTKMNKKQIFVTAVTTLLIAAIAGTTIFFGVRAVKLNQYEERKIKLSRKFTITAHTGCMGTNENSLKSMHAGANNGADIIEFDVHFTEDGAPVLSHDEPKGDEVGLEEAFDYLAHNKGLKANVDMKSTKNMAEIQKLADKYGVTKQIFFTGIKLEDVEAVKKNCPRISYYLNVDVDKERNTDVEYINSLVNEVKDSGAIGINFNYKSASAELSKYFHSNKLLVSVWTVDDKLDMYEALETMPDNITTRKPDVLCEIIENMS